MLILKAKITLGVNGLDFCSWGRWSGPRKPGWSR